MTYNETILFRRFMESKGVLNNYEYLYRSHRFDNRDINQFFDEVDAEDVILSAFDLSGARSTIFGYQYWKKMNEKWQVRLSEYRNSGQLEENAQILCVHCKRTLPKSSFAYTTKGVLHKHCKECESGEWDRKRKEKEKEEQEREKQEKAAKQLEKEIMEKETKLNKTTKVCTHCGKRKLRSEFLPSSTSEDGLQSWCRKCQDAAANVSAEADWQMEREKKREEMIELPSAKPASLDKLTAPKLGEYDATLHYKAAQKSITFNATLSEQLQAGQFTKCHLKTDMAQRLFLIFNRVEGANVVGVSSRASMLLGINSADICRSLAARFNLSLGENYYLHITRNLSRREEVATIEVLAVRSREEYVGIAQRRDGNEPSESELEHQVVQHQPIVETPALKKSEPKKPETKPTMEFSTPMKAEEKLQWLIENNHLTEQDLAAFLYKKGWKLQEPVRSYKKFTL